MNYYTDDFMYSGSEDLAIQLKKMDKNDPEYTIIGEEYWEALEREEEETNGYNYCSMLKKVME